MTASRDYLNEEDEAPPRFEPTRRDQALKTNKQPRPGSKLPRCATSVKASFSSTAKAKAAIREHSHPDRPTLHPYQCSCGCWHITSRPQRSAP